MKLSRELILRLQTTAGNRAVQKLVERWRMAALQAEAPPLPEARSMVWWSSILATVRTWWRKVTKNE